MIRSGSNSSAGSATCIVRTKLLPVNRYSFSMASNTSEGRQIFVDFSVVTTNPDEKGMASVEPMGFGENKIHL